MKKINTKILLGTVGVLSVLSYSAFAANQTGNASATISTLIAVTEDTQMAFGNVSVDSAGGTVTLTSAGGISADNANYVFSGTPAGAAFSATGDASAPVTISFSTGDTLTGPGTAMALQNFTNDAGGSPAFDGTGNLAFNVGADLVVNASQTAGSYSGTYTITVDYQ